MRKISLIVFAACIVGISCQLHYRGHRKHTEESKGTIDINSIHQHVKSMQQQRDIKEDSSSRRRKFSPQHFRAKDSNDVLMASVVLQDGKFRIAPNIWEQNAIAYGMLGRALNTTGWDVLDLVAGVDTSVKNDTALMYAAGLLEGYLTADRIGLMYKNSMAAQFSTEYSQKVLLPRVRDFFRRQYEWARDFAARNSGSAFGRHTGFLLAQLQGLIDGYMSRNDTIVRDPFVLHLINAGGDIGDIQTAVNDTKLNFFDRMTAKEFKNFVQGSGRCSALVRITPGLERLFMGHSTWSGYESMLRMYKHYYLNLEDKDTASRRLSFSSYPGTLESIDDFYILDSNLVILETTNNVFNVSLYKFINPQTLLSWQRVRVASHIARNGSHWAWAVGQENSGTYNNQYIIIDLNRIKPNVSIDDGALTIVEQIPTLVVSSDQTGILRTGYFPSYNVPFHEKIYNMSGYPDVVAKRGLDFSYQMAPRAKIFRREAPNVFDEAGMANVLRFNRYADDPYSEGDPCDSICCRRDLRPSGKDDAARGCMDSKFTDFDMAKYMASFAVSGPTTGIVGHSLPPFSWKQYPNVSHVGLPYAYDFDWFVMSPTVL